MAVHNLPFREVWALDFEFVSDPGDRPRPVCMVARELGSRRLLRLWSDQLVPGEPPFDTGDDVLFVAYFASAEIGCFLQLGWPIPRMILDLYVEFSNKINGVGFQGGKSLLGALSYHGISSITSAQKSTERDLIIDGGPWSPAERQRIIDYCQTDVDPMDALLERMLPDIRKGGLGLVQALARGRYMAAVARMERFGVPIDVDTLDDLRDRWADIKDDLIGQIDEDFGVYEGTTFRSGLFAKYCVDNGIDWPRTASGRLSLERDTFNDMCKRFPQLEPLKDLRHAMSELRLEKLQVGADGRNRMMLSPFGAKTGRNTPSNNRFIFGPSVWLRGLIKPAPGKSLAYVDWSSQEVYIAAHLSGDPNLLAAVKSGDPYLAFAKMAGLAPDDATKESHKAIRDVCKKVVLGTNYGMQAESVARNTGLTVIEAKSVLRKLDQTFPTYMAWADRVVDSAQLTGYQRTVFGWTVRGGTNSRPTSARNFPMQANGAEMLRLACCLATEAGIRVCAPVHDALLVEGDTDDMDRVVEVTQQAMSDAALAVLPGLDIPTDVDRIDYPDRYADPRGAVMWTRIVFLLNGVQGGQGGQGGEGRSRG